MNKLLTIIGECLSMVFGLTITIPMMLLIYVALPLAMLAVPFMILSSIF